CLQYNRIPLTF
nr:immunoglobulin light chain junction region [Macaca mulatta]MOW08025.1 immunoglobulin light chain junction region [Macaca mulatta]MOW08145.1 immunoglobulin light chain junction region [Macaca mulatta]MOW09623.1 immunoglobulin light chain junction region [Macaca mulatta]MOW10920.1 immunoglobulin light chain junction region [Macaca mulatta]